MGDAVIATENTRSPSGALDHRRPRVLSGGIIGALLLALALLAPLSPATAQTASGPRVVISAPRDQASVEYESVALAGLVSSDDGVRLVVVTLNGAEVARQREPTSPPVLALSLPLVLREGANTLVVSATDGVGATREEVRIVFYERREPLTLMLRSPTDRARLAEPLSVVAAEATSSRRVARVDVTVNGTSVHRQAPAQPQTTVAVSVPVRLRDGDNVIVVTAAEPDGTEVQEVRTVFLDRPREATPAPPAPQPTERWAVVIGVGVYEQRTVPPLRFPAADAEAVYQVLTGSAGFKADHVVLLTDRTERKPTLRNIKWALGTFLARSARKADTVLVFFAGHGAPEVDPRGIERDGLAKYLVPRDADPEDLYATALPMDEIETVFSRIEAERVVAFFDTCYSGAAGGRTFMPTNTRAAATDDGFLARAARAKGRAIITAARPSEVSLELPELGHGVFSYYLVEGLRGAADLNRDGVVTLQELYGYVEQQVSRRAREAGGNQHPVLKGEVEGVLPLVQVRIR